MLYKKVAMDKKDIYEHLAKIYLDTPLKSEKRIKDFPSNKVSRNFFFISGTIILILLFVIVLISRNKRAKDLQAQQLSSEMVHLIQNEAIKIDYNFDPAKKEIYSVDLGKLDLNPYKTLNFSVKKSNYGDNLAVRVEFTNTFQEKSELYVRDVTNKWQHYKLNLADFKNISNWSEISSLSFVIEEWNTTDKQGSVFIDNIRLLR